MKTVRRKFEAPKPCPFCGGKAQVLGSGIVTAVYVRCKDCDSCGPEFAGKTELAATKLAVKAWNTRVT